jgi:glycosyltransferase involved in cell wall biosynthesis
MAALKIGYFPYRPGTNPYQRLFATSLEGAGLSVERISPRKLFPLRFAAAQQVDLLQLDWPHDWYRGRNRLAGLIKRAMYRDGLARLEKMPVVWTAHNLRAHDALDDAYEHQMIQALINVCNGIIVLSEVSVEILRREYSVPKRTLIEVVRHGHYIGCYANSISRHAARLRLGIPERPRVILSLGRLEPYKGLEDLMEAFGRVARAGDVLLLAGQASSKHYSEQLRQAVSALRRPDVRIVLRDTSVPDDELQIYFNACDVVVLPFRQVLNSGSLLLAMSFGCPVIAPRLGSIPEIACPEGWFGYDPAGARELAEALDRARAAANLEGLRERILDFTAARYDWVGVGTRAKALYEAIVDGVTPAAPPAMRD